MNFSLKGVAKIIKLFQIKKVFKSWIANFVNFESDFVNFESRATNFVNFESRIVNFETLFYDFESRIGGGYEIFRIWEA